MEDVIQSRWLSIFGSVDRRPIHEWAHDHVQLPAVLTHRGKFDASPSRHFIEPLLALADDAVRQVVIRKPVRGGGTLIGDIWQCWTRANDPGPAMDIFQTDVIADEHAESRLMPMFKRCAPIVEKLPEDRHSIRKTEIMFRDGLPYYITGPGIANLQTKGIRYMRIDEAWLMKPGIIQEAEGRLGDFIRTETSKLAIISQAGEEEDELDQRFTAGDCSTWHIPCLGCGEFFAPQWTHPKPDGTKAGMKWDEHRDNGGYWQTWKCLENIRFLCPMCGHEHRDSPRLKNEWNQRGKFVAMNPTASRRNRSFHWNAIIDFPWRELVGLFLDAANAQKRGVYEPMIAFIQKRLAEPKSTRTIGLSAIDAARKPLDLGWKEEFVRIATVDRQSDHYWMLVCAWSKAGECRRLWFGRLYSRADIKVKADEWKVHNVINDAGFEARGPQGVYKTCSLFHTEEQRWIAAKGDKEKSYRRRIGNGEIIESSYAEPILADSELGAQNRGVGGVCVLFRFSSDRMADKLKNLIERGLWIEPSGIDEKDEIEIAYRDQMSSEFKKREMSKKTGRYEWIWFQARVENHAWDCAKMQVLGATLADILPDLEPVEPAADLDPPIA